MKMNQLIKLMMTVLCCAFLYTCSQEDKFLGVSTGGKSSDDEKNSSDTRHTVDQEGKKVAEAESDDEGEDTNDSKLNFCKKAVGQTGSVPPSTVYACEEKSANAKSALTVANEEECFASIDECEEALRATSSRPSN